MFHFEVIKHPLKKENYEFWLHFKFGVINTPLCLLTILFPLQITPRARKSNADISKFISSFFSACGLEKK